MGKRKIIKGRKRNICIYVYTNKYGWRWKWNNLPSILLLNRRRCSLQCGKIIIHSIFFWLKRLHYSFRFSSPLFETCCIALKRYKIMECGKQTSKYSTFLSTFSATLFFSFSFLSVLRHFFLFAKNLRILIFQLLMSQRKFVPK